MDRPEPRAEVFARERQQRIARVVEEHGRARVSELSERFGVSSVTIRKDLLTLEAEGRIVRAHGGAIATPDNRAESAFQVRERLRRAEKDRIGELAAAMVMDGESIALDASTTALAVARHLKQRGGWGQLSVITNGLRIASELAGFPGITVAMPGGFVRAEAMSVVGELGDAVFSKVNVQKAFLGAAGFTLESGLADATADEAQIKRFMAEAAREVIGIVDSSKWGRDAFATFCRADELGAIITDDLASGLMVRALRDQGTSVHIVGSPEPESSGERSQP